MIPDHPGVTLRSQEVHRSEKKRKKNPEKPDFPVPDPDFRISAYGIANGAPRATCSQNFRPLAALEAEITRSLTIIKYRIYESILVKSDTKNILNLLRALYVLWT